MPLPSGSSSMPKSTKRNIRLQKQEVTCEEERRSEWVCPKYCEQLYGCCLSQNPVLWGTICSGHWVHYQKWYSITSTSPALLVFFVECFERTTILSSMVDRNKVRLLWPLWNGQGPRNGLSSRHCTAGGSVRYWRLYWAADTGSAASYTHSRVTNFLGQLPPKYTMLLRGVD